MSDSTKRVGRRRFLWYAAAGAGAVGVGGAAGYRMYRRRDIPKAPIVEDRAGVVDDKAVVSQRRTLGRTGLEISIVSIGAGGLKGPEPVVRAVDKGMNYVDTSVCYGDSEKVIRRALKSSPGLRDKLIIATKWDATVRSTRDEILASLDKSLSRLGVDHVDIMQLHWLGGGHTFPDNGLNRLDNPEIDRAMEDAKKAGKVRFFGATSHAGDRGKILEHAIDKGNYDMILVKMNVLDFEEGGVPSLLSKAKAKNIGVVAMKSQPSGGRIPKGYENSKYSIFQANLRWALEQAGVTSVVNSKIGVDPHFQDLAASAVQEKLGALDHALLLEYASALSPEYCRGCAGACSDACPSGVAIPHVLQFSMYDRDYGWHAQAREHYRALPVEQRFSDQCLSCSECTGACPFGVDAASGVRGAQQRLG